DEALQLLNRRLEMMPMGPGLTGGGSSLEGGTGQELLGRLESIENRLSAITSLPGGTFQGDSIYSEESAAGGAAIADLRVRLTQIEEVMRALNGKLDDVSFRLTKFSERFEQVSADSEFRFQQLELAAAGAGSKAQQNTSSEPQVLGTMPVSPPESVELLAKAETVTLIGETAPDTPLITSQENRAAATAGIQASGQGGSDAFSGTPKEIYDLALKKLQMGAYQEAQAELQNFLDLYPRDRLAGNAQYWLGETFYVQRDYKNATAAFLAGYTNYNNSIKAPDSLLKLGMTLVIMGEKKTGCDAFAELSARFPDAPQAIVRRAEIESQRAECSS
ncbi:MAG: tol-pal system protein YbgF, partial [Pseudomonadota bacterium]|nr:tol-pal system protein YbgF [Pseudomonadota bacterium]